MNKLFIILFLFIINSAFSQDENSYFVEILDHNNLPSISQVNKNEVKLFFNDKNLNTLLDNYKIVDFREAFPLSKRKNLQVVYEIVIDNDSLKTALAKFSNIFSVVELVPVNDILYVPNDYGVDDSVELEQASLELINAPEAWDITQGNPAINIGIADVGINLSHPDLINKSEIIHGSQSSSSGHGTNVGLFAAAETDNNYAASGIGFNCQLKFGTGISACIPLAISGAKVINISLGSCYNSNPSSSYLFWLETLMDEVVNDYGVVVVAAAGNGEFSCSAGATEYHYPAATSNVIAVTAVGCRYEADDTTPGHGSKKDIFINTENSVYPTTTYNDLVDLSAPGRGLVLDHPTLGLINYAGGTSYAAPIVAGTIGLMFSVNECLTPIEVESILKLTSVDIDNIPLNLPYAGGLGAGRLDAHQAVKMASDMNDPNGIVSISDRDFYRFNFHLFTAPFKIELSNQTFRDDATADFTAKNSIELTEGTTLDPGVNGYVELNIDATINNSCAPTNTPNSAATENKKGFLIENEDNLVIYPNPTRDILQLQLLSKNDKIASVQIYNIQGYLISEITSLENNSLNISDFKKGIYLIKVQTIHQNSFTEKVIKI